MKTDVVKVEYDASTDTHYICSKLFEDAGWNIGDTIEWIDNNDGSWTMRKKENA